MIHFCVRYKLRICGNRLRNRQGKIFSENKSEQRLLDSVRASCTVPILYQISEFEGGKYVDGSIADAVPFDRAFEQGCSRVLVLLTKPENEPCTDYRKFEFLINKNTRTIRTSSTLL